MKVFFDGTTNTVTVKGVRISLQALHAITDADPYTMYLFTREEDGTINLHGFPVFGAYVGDLPN